MNKYRFLPTGTWSDDTFLKMSPEQKLIYLYLVTSPYTSMCGIFKLSVSTMGHFLGLRNDNIESAWRGFLLAFPDWVKYDEETGEVAVLYWPKFALVNANVGALKKAERELGEVTSMHLLKEIIKRNSATMSKMYLSRLRQLQIKEVNAKKLEESLNFDPDQKKYGDTAQVSENECIESQIEIEIEIEKNNDQIKDVDHQVSDWERRFDEFWDRYNRKVGKKKAKTAFKNLSKAKQLACMDQSVIAAYDKFLLTTGYDKCHPTSWINGERWDDDFAVQENTDRANRDSVLNDKLLPEPLNTEYQRYVTYVIDTFPVLWKSKCQILSKSQWYELTQTEVFPNLRVAMTPRKAKAIRTQMHFLFNDNNFERAKYNSLYDAIKQEYRRHINHEKTLIA